MVAQRLEALKDGKTENQQEMADAAAHHPH